MNLMATVTPAHQLAVANLYSALFNRAPDAAGFAFWTQALADGASPFSIAATFVATPEARTTYAGAQTAEQFVALFYTTVFGRAPDAGGLAFWVQSLDAAGGIGSDTAKAQLLTQIIDLLSTPLAVRPDGLSDTQYAQTLADRAIFVNKSAIGMYFASELKSLDLGLAKQVLGAITADPASIAVAKGIANDTAGGGGGGSGAIDPLYHYLTTGTDTLAGGAGKDVFVADLVNAIPDVSVGDATLAADDSIDGGAGIDRFDIVGAANFAAFRHADIRNVEQVHAKVAGDLFDVSENADVQEVWVTSASTAGSTILLRKDQIAGLEGAQGDSVKFMFASSAGSADSATLALADTTGMNRLRIGAIESLTIHATGINTITSLDTAAAQSLTVTGTGKLSTAMLTGAYTLVDASANSGGLTFDMSTVGGNAKIIGSSAQDEITIDFATFSDSNDIDLGAGLDTLGFAVSNAQIDENTVSYFSGIKNVEAFKFNGAITATVDGSITDVSTFLINTTGLTTFTRLASSDIIMIGGVDAAANHYSMDTGQSIFGIVMAGTDAAIARANDQIVTGSSIISIASTGSAAQGSNILSITADDGNNILVFGAKDLLLTLSNAGGVTGHTVNASSLGGKFTVTGTASSDTIIGGASDDLIDGGQTIFAAGVPQSVDTLTGGAGADTFSFSTPGISTAHAGLTAVITDFRTGQDKLKIAGISAASTDNFASAQAGAADLAALLSAADQALNGTVQIYVGRIGADAYVVTDTYGTGHTNVIKLIGGAANGVAMADFIA
jgi:hypothetical protein